MIKAAIAKTLRTLVLSGVCVLAAACASQSDPQVRNRSAAAAAPEQVIVTAPASTRQADAIAAYQEYLTRYPDSPEYDSITRRLADLHLELAADELLTGVSTPESAKNLQAKRLQAYAEPIRLYQDLLQKNPHGPDSTAILYQLSRAYEESGRTQDALTTINRLLARNMDVDVRLYGDTRFRQGELLFGERSYLEAGRAYQAVVDLGPSMEVYEQSLYKLGWSLFKQQRYQESLPVLFTLLELKVPPGKAYEYQLSKLTVADSEQVSDLLRVISRSFTHLGGTDALDDYFTNNSERCCEKQVYLELADWYVSQERVSEAARTWQALAQRNPLSAEAPRLIARAIKLCQQAGFPQRVKELETLFVQTYGTNSEFWTMYPASDFADVEELLQASLQDLASFSHGQARTTGNTEDIREAQRWYREYLASFPDEEAAAEMNFQLAELLYEDEQYRQALEEYEHTAWSRGAHSRAVDAAVGGLHANDKLLQQADASEQAALTERATAMALRFISNYPEHPASPTLLAQAGTTLLQQHQYDRALGVSEKVVTDSISTATALRQVAWSLRAQAFYSTGDYSAATAAYQEALQIADKNDERFGALQKGLAMATYQQAEQVFTEGDKHSAATLYQRAADLTPDAALRSKASYDAATTLLALELWPEAIRMLEQFNEDYPDDPLQKDVPPKLAYAYERNGNSRRAADEFLRLSRDDRQADALQREALLQAGKLFLQAGAVPQAIAAGEHYIEQFPNPPEIAVGVMQQLADIESSAGNVQRRKYWLEEIIKLDHTTGSPRTHLPAAESALEMAEYRLAAFRSIQLVNPVQDNLTQKIASMKQALQAFETAIEYGISPVTTAATYHIASMYNELGRALLNSERPAKLTIEELSEYNLLLIQQAAPFEQQAIDLYTINAQRSGGDPQDLWIKKSAQQLVELQNDQ